MKIFVKVKTGAPEEKLTRVDDKHYLAQVKAHPIDGEANEALFALLGRFFHVASSTITLVHGGGAREKIIEVPLTRDALDPLLDE